MNRKLKLEELNRVSIADFKQQKKDPVIVLLDNVRSLHNVGSVFRTCDAMAVEKLYLCGITAKPPHREIQKTAIGATESVNWEYMHDAISIIHHYKNDDGLITNVETSGFTSVSNYDYEVVENDKKREINIIEPGKIDGIVRRFEEVMSA